MLRSFRVANHKSFRDEAELLLMPAYDKSRPVVPVAGIFGANASGKSNLLDALAWMRSAVLSSHFGWDPDRGVPRHPFRLDEPSQQRGSVYCIEAVIDSVRHTYGFEVDDERIKQEWLYTYPRGRRRVVFERDTTWTFGTGVARGRTDTIRELTRSNALFLGLAAQLELDEALPIYRWFRRLTVETAQPRLRPRIKATVDWLRRSNADRQVLIELIRGADLGVEGIVVNEEPEPGPRDDDDYDLLFEHGAILLSLTEQSEGTLAWLRLVVPALEVLDSGGVLCVDEIDSSLHPRLTARLVELFRSEETNSKGAQLVFTTHDATLLGTSFGREVLARDEIWFVEKDRDGASTLFPLSDFRPRKEENTERRYLNGSYGAVPMVFSDTLVDNVVAAREEAEHGRRENTGRRRFVDRPARRPILVVCGSAKTEHAYLRGLRDAVRNPAVDVTLVNRTRHPHGVVRFAIQHARAATPDFDEIWCVFDVDEFDIGPAVEAATGGAVEVAVSNPCFELWLLLHHADCRSHCNGCEDVTRRLKRHLPAYDKARLRFADFADSVTDAVRRARQLGEGNPSTGVWRLVQLIGEKS